MFENYSKTQATNIATFASVIVLILQRLDIVLTDSEATTIITAGIIIYSTIQSWIKRQKEGDLTKIGFRK